MTDWINAPSDPIYYAGMVYKITRLEDGKFYVGSKKYWFRHKMKPLKGRVNKRHKLKPSGWETYWGSNNELLLEIGKKGHMAFNKTILMNCSSVAKMQYLEHKLIMMADLILRDDSYNNFIGGKIGGRQFKDISIPIIPEWVLKELGIC